MPATPRAMPTTTVTSASTTGDQRETMSLA